MNIRNKITAFLLATVTACSVTAMPIITSAVNYNWRKGGFSGGNCWTTSQVYYAYESNPKVTFYSYFDN